MTGVAREQAFGPENELEAALVRARAGSLGVQDFLRVLVGSELAVPSGDDVLADGSGFRPLLFRTDKGTMVACFTSRPRIGAFAERAPFCLMINGGAFLKRVPAGFGLVVNPGLEVGLEISPDGLAEVSGLVG